MEGQTGEESQRLQLNNLLAEMDAFALAPDSGGGSDSGGGGGRGAGGGSSSGGGSSGIGIGVGGGGGVGSGGGFTSMASERGNVQREISHHDEVRAATTVDDECCVCMDARRGCVLIPCGHTNMCWACAQDLVGGPLAAGQSPACPMCLQPVQNLFQAHI